MGSTRPRPNDRLNSGSVPLEEEIQALQGEEMPEDQDALLEPDEFEGRPEFTDTERYLGDAETHDPDHRGTAEGIESLEGLGAQGLRVGETDNPYVASDEGLTYVPPSNPPIVPTDTEGGADVPGANLDEGESEMNAQIRETLRANAATSPLADRIVIAVVGSTAILRGVVDGPEDGDALVEVASSVPGITDVRDETEVATP